MKQAIEPIGCRKCGAKAYELCTNAGNPILLMHQERIDDINSQTLPAKKVKRTKKKVGIPFLDTSDKTIAIVPMVGIQENKIQTKLGNILRFFYNADNNLLVVDLIAANETGGVELLRMVLDESSLLSHT